MKKLTLEEIKKLPPEERIPYLKQLEEERKKEIEEAEKILLHSESEIRNKQEKIEEEEINEIRKNEIRALATSKESDLENKVKEEQPEESNLPVQYGAPLEQIRALYEVATSDIYNGIKNLRDKASESGLTREEEKKFLNYETAFSKVNAVQAAYIEDKEKRVMVMKAKEALDQIRKYASGNY